MLRDGTISFYHADGLGSVTSLSNTTGALGQSYTFDSFGNQTASFGSLTNSFRYTWREFRAGRRRQGHRFHAWEDKTELLGF